MTEKTRYMNYTNCLCYTCRNDTNWKNSVYMVIECWNCEAYCFTKKETNCDFECCTTNCVGYMKDPEMLEEEQMGRN